MSHQLQSHAIRREGNARAPGTDPTPKRRSNTEPQKDAATPATTPKRRRRRRCGSSKAKAKFEAKQDLAKALISLMLEEGIVEFREDRLEAKKPNPQLNESDREPTLEQLVLKDLGLEDPTAAVEADQKPVIQEDYFIVSFTLDPQGKEVPLFRGETSGKLFREDELPVNLRKPVTQAENSAREKIREVLASITQVRVPFKMGDIAQAAMNNPRIVELLNNYRTPPAPAKEAQPPPEKRGFRCSHAGQAPPKKKPDQGKKGSKNQKNKKHQRERAEKLN